MRVIASVLLCTFVSSCHQVPMAPLAEPASIEGVVTQVSVRPDGSGEVDLRELTWLKPPSAAQSAAAERTDIARVHLGRTADPAAVATMVFVQREGSLEKASLAQVREGLRVRVWTTDVVLRSLPPQYYARQLVITVTP